jgi:molybdopterin synthase sulfur carrier subunit
VKTRTPARCVLRVFNGVCGLENQRNLLLTLTWFILLRPYGKMALIVKFLGSLRHVSRVRELALDYKERFSIGELVNELAEELPELKRSLIDRQLEDPRPNALILVNGREISVLNGLETQLKDGDEIVFVPVVHGG